MRRYPLLGIWMRNCWLWGWRQGLKGANFSGRPFTGDYAGDLLYPTLLKFGFAHGEFLARANDGLEMVNARITNAVRCVPPQNKPVGEEMKNCLPFLTREMEAMPHLKVILSLGLISHNAVLKATGHKQSAFKFGHGAVHDLGNGLTLIDSYHCSRYNTNTGRLTVEMFEDVFGDYSGAALKSIPYDFLHMLYSLGQSLDHLPPHP